MGYVLSQLPNTLQRGGKFWFFITSYAKKLGTTRLYLRYLDFLHSIKTHIFAIPILKIMGQMGFIETHYYLFILSLSA
jgi:hypothetical protein